MTRGERPIACAAGLLSGTALLLPLVVFPDALVRPVLSGLLLVVDAGLALRPSGRRGGRVVADPPVVVEEAGQAARARAR